MLHDLLQGEWTHARLLDLFGKRTPEEIEPKDTAIALICALLNRLQKLPDTRIAEVKLVLGVAIRFGDNSAVEMHAKDGSTFLNSYINDRDSYITVMEYNRETDRAQCEKWLKEIDDLKAQVNWVRGLTAMRGCDAPLAPACSLLADWLDELDRLREIQARKGD